MSNFRKNAVNPSTGQVELAEWIDDYFGPHQYGVRFQSDESVVKEQDLVLVFETRITRLSVVPVGGKLFESQVTNIEIADEAAGEFILVTQCGDIEKGISIEKEDWPSIRDAIGRMYAELRLD